MRSLQPARSSTVPGISEAIARRALEIAADICVYTNHNIVVESVDSI